MNMVGWKNSRLASQLLAVGVVFGTISSAIADAPKVVASILPVSGLTAAVMEGVGKPTLLMPADRSPHDFQLLPSQARAMQSADLVIWVGPGLESALPKAVKTLSESTTRVRLIDTEGLSFPEGGHDHEHKHDHDDDHSEDHGDDHDDGHADDHDDGHKEEGEVANLDHHIWLNPQNAIAIVKRITSALSDIDPNNEKKYTSNSEQLIEKLTKLDEELKGSFTAVPKDSYLVFHQAYRHFENRYGLENAGSVISHEEVSPGARRVRELNKLIAKGNIQCVFSEPQYDPKLARSLVDGSKAKTQVLDPMGQNIESGADHYVRLIRTLAKSMLNCLS